ncbi:hypothetical protein [Rhodoferax antarcticus]|uniref:Uncharacterized protein n=1 Tax=Rhodoferax antarcticus ANT.BR TaxID=1111071 RepID=A0A1Q8Y9B8_9BURK|nr:hypothetical protein [Rhodoferax antarcticus]OLP04569.1 hypothetical protein BLL52_4255 [Rhodoferax antarcticus ANT.BR]
MCDSQNEWGGSPSNEAPDSWWVDDDTGEYVSAKSGERMSAEDARKIIRSEAGLTESAPKSILPIINRAQATLLEFYGAGDFEHLLAATNADELKRLLDSCGDGLLRFLMVELSSHEDCESVAVAINRVTNAIDDLNAVHRHLDSLPDQDELFSTPTTEQVGAGVSRSDSKLTYKGLAELIAYMPPERQDDDVTIYVSGVGESYSALEFGSIDSLDHKGDIAGVLDDGHRVIKV